MSDRKPDIQWADFKSGLAQLYVAAKRRRTILDLPGGMDEFVRVKEKEGEVHSVVYHALREHFDQKVEYFKKRIAEEGYTHPDFEPKEAPAAQAQFATDSKPAPAPVATPAPRRKRNKPASRPAPSKAARSAARKPATTPSGRAKAGAKRTKSAARAVKAAVKKGKPTSGRAKPKAKSGARRNK